MLARSGARAFKRVRSASGEIGSSIGERGFHFSAFELKRRRATERCPFRGPLPNSGAAPKRRGKRECARWAHRLGSRVVALGTTHADADRKLVRRFHSADHTLRKENRFRTCMVAKPDVCMKYFRLFELRVSLLKVNMITV